MYIKILAAPESAGKFMLIVKGVSYYVFVSTTSTFQAHNVAVNIYFLRESKYWLSVFVRPSRLSIIFLIIIRTSPFAPEHHYCVGIDRYFAGLLPGNKVEKIEELMDGTRKIAFAGDGINDAPVLTRADVGIAMGALGSDAAIEAADVVLMDDQPSKIATAIRIARRTIGIARQNIWFAIGVKIAVLVLAAFGIATMWLAVFADVGVTVLAVLNAMRALRA